MFYRILMAPPGYAPRQRYMPAAYKTLEFDSCRGGVSNSDGSTFFGSLEETRQAIPGDAQQLFFQPEHQFLELWESSPPCG